MFNCYKNLTWLYFLIARKIKYFRKMLCKQFLIAILVVSLLFGSLNAKKIDKKRPKRQILSCVGCVGVSYFK